MEYDRGCHNYSVDTWMRFGRVALRLPCYVSKIATACSPHCWTRFKTVHFNTRCTTTAAESRVAACKVRLLHLIKSTIFSSTISNHCQSFRLTFSSNWAHLKKFKKRWRTGSLCVALFTCFIVGLCVGVGTGLCVGLYVWVCLYIVRSPLLRFAVAA